MIRITDYFKAFWAFAHLFAKVWTWKDYVKFRKNLKDVDEWRITV